MYGDDEKLGLKENKQEQDNTTVDRKLYKNMRFSDVKKITDKLIYDKNIKQKVIKKTLKKMVQIKMTDAQNSIIKKINELNLNPKNWGINDYTNKGDFNNAYTNARQAGEQEFMWNNIRYNTNYKGTSKEQLAETGITNAQLQYQNIIKKRLVENLNPYGYFSPISRVYNAVILNEKANKADGKRQDAFNLYMGKPQTNNTFDISEYKPSNSKNENVEYFKIKNYNYQKRLLDVDVNTHIKTGQNVRRYDAEAIMGTFTVSKGEDDKGKYMSYYDKWDLNPLRLKNPFTGEQIPTDIGKPFEIYDRVYYTEDEEGNKIMIQK
jgi:hypothetical protein